MEPNVGGWISANVNGEPYIRDGKIVEQEPTTTTNETISASEETTPEEFFAEGTLPLAETTPAPSKKYEPINVERFSEGLYNQRDFVKVDGDRIQMTTDEATVAVDAVLSAQSGYKFDFFRDDLANRVIALEETQTKIIAALKHLGLDTNKHFR